MRANSAHNMWSNFVTKVWMITARRSSNTLCLLHVEFHPKPPKKCSSFKLFKCVIKLFLLNFLYNIRFKFLALEASLAALLPYLIALLCACSIFFSRYLSSFSSFSLSLAIFLAMVYKPDWFFLASLLALVFCLFLRPLYHIFSSFSKFPYNPMYDIPLPIPYLNYLRLILDSWYILASTLSSSPANKTNSLTPCGNLFDKAT